MTNKFLHTMLLILIGLHLSAQDIYMVKSGDVSFVSDAPLEVIKAESSQLQGALKIDDRSFAFRIPMKSFEGFNSSLQRTHFNENYLETSKFEFTIFEGKVIEDIDFTQTGTFNVRGKGKFICHGIEQERIIRCKITISTNKISIKSDFSVLLDDHDITIPRVVSQKIAKEITVSIDVEMTPRK